MLLPHRLHLSRCSWHYIFHHYSSCRFARWCCGCVCLALNVAGDRWKRQAPGSLFVFDCEAGGGRDHVPDLWHPHAKRQRHIHTHTWTHAPSVTGPWQAWPRRGGWAKRRWREAEGEEAECRTPPAILHPLFPSLSLGPSFLIPWQWPCAPPLLSRSHTHTQGQAVHVSPTRQIHHLPSGPSSSPLLLLALIGWVRRDWDGRGSTLHPCNCC